MPTSGVDKVSLGWCLRSLRWLIRWRAILDAVGDLHVIQVEVGVVVRIGEAEADAGLAEGVWRQI